MNKKTGPNPLPRFRVKYTGGRLDLIRISIGKNYRDFPPADVLKIADRLVDLAERSEAHAQTLP